MPSFFKSRDWTPKRTDSQNIGYSKAQYGQYGPDIQHQHMLNMQQQQQSMSMNPSHLVQLQQLSERLRHLQHETQSITDGLHLRQSPSPAENGPPWSDISTQHMRTSSPFQQNGGPLGRGISQAHAMPPSGIPTADGTELDLEQLLNEGRQARAQSASMSSSPRPHMRMPAPATEADFRPSNPAFANNQSASRNISGMSHGFEERLSALNNPVSHPFSANITENHRMPERQYAMKGFNDPFTTMSPPNPLNEFGLGSPPNAIPSSMHPMTAYQQFQSRPSNLPSAATTDLFGREAFHIPSPFDAAQQHQMGPAAGINNLQQQHPHPSFRAGFGMQPQPFSHTQEQMPFMMPQSNRSGPSPRLFGF